MTPHDPPEASIRTAAGLQVGLRVVQLDAWGAALQYFTGSQAHNIAVRQVTIRQKLKLSEYGLFDTGEEGELIVSRTEEEVYARLGLAWVPPAMREDHGEVEAAAQGEIPRLVQQNDLQGDLHTHTDLTDGVASLEDMVAAAARRGYAYYAITDHAPNLVFQRMTDEKMLAQRDRVRALDAPLELLHGTELNIAPDGAVDWDEASFGGQGLRTASVHSNFDPGLDDPPLRHGLREPAGQHHRAPPHQADRAAAAGRGGLRGAVPGLRPHRDRAGDQRLAAAA